MRWLACLGALSMLLVSACERAGPSSGSAPMESPNPASAEAACPGWRAASYQQGFLERDVDGDGVRDTVRLSVDRTGPPGCKAFVVVQSQQGDLVAPISDENIPFHLGLPSLNNLVEIDDRDGAEVVADITAGASTTFAGVFSAAGGRLRRMRFAGDAMPQGDLFPYGGSVGHLESSDCASKRRVVVSAATPSGRRYQLERRFFAVHGTRLILEATDRLLVDIRDLDDYPEFAGPPFVSCD